MSRYIDEILQPDEKLLYSTTLHWVLYLPGLIACVVALAAYLVGRDAASAFVRMLLFGVFVVAGLYGVASLFAAWFRRWTTEVDVTDRRIVVKRGFINRRTVEMNMDKIESIDVDQSLAGRLFNYGRVTIRGTGVSIEPLPSIGAPLELRNHITAR